jgi:capsular exopolysaccharide synthesis family protein
VLSTGPNALALLKALRRRWLLAAAAALLLAPVLGVGAWFAAPSSRHSVRMLIHVPPPRSQFVPIGGPQPDLPNHQRTQVALIKTRFVLSAALRDPKVAGLPVFPPGIDPVEWLEQQIRVDFSVAPELLRIEMSGAKPQELKVLVDALGNTYVREIVDREATRREERRQKLQEIRQKFDEQVQRARNEQKKIELQAGARDPNVRAQTLRFVQQQLDAEEQALIKLNEDIRRVRLQLEAEKEVAAQGAAEVQVPEKELDRAVSENPSVKSLAEEVQRLEKEISLNLEQAVLGEDEPLVRDLRRKQGVAKKALADQQVKVRPEVRQALREKGGAETGLGVAKLEAQLKGLLKTEAVLKPEVERLRERVQSLAKHGAKMDDLREDLGHIEALSKKLAMEEAALMVEQSVPPNSRIMEPASVTHAMSKSKQLLVTAGAAGAGLALALFGVAWWEFRARRVDSVDEVALGLGMPVVGALPDSRRTPRRLLPWGASAETYGAALLTESIDAVRTMLMHRARTESVQVVMITSAMPGEGKTSLSCHLAASLARVGLKTLLIDGDLRNPTAHRLFELENGVGLCDLLRGEAAAAEVTQPTALAGLAVITAGQWDYAAAQGLARNRLGAALGPLRREYDFILIDSSPVLPVTDALLLGQSVDGVIFSILRDVSRLPSVYMASQRLTAVGARTLGAVVNGISEGLYVSSYPYVRTAPPAPGADASDPASPAAETE